MELRKDFYTQQELFEMNTRANKMYHDLNEELFTLKPRTSIKDRERRRQIIKLRTEAFEQAIWAEKMLYMMGPQVVK